MTPPNAKTFNLHHISPFFASILTPKIPGPNRQFLCAFNLRSAGRPGNVKFFRYLKKSPVFLTLLSALQTLWCQNSIKIYQSWGQKNRENWSLFFLTPRMVSYILGGPPGGPLCQFHLRHLKKRVKKNGGVKKSGDIYVKSKSSVRY